MQYNADNSDTSDSTYQNETTSSSDISDSDHLSDHDSDSDSDDVIFMPNLGNCSENYDDIVDAAEHREPIPNPQQQQAVGDILANIRRLIADRVENPNPQVAPQPDFIPLNMPEPTPGTSGQGIHNNRGDENDQVAPEPESPPNHLNNDFVMNGEDAGIADVNNNIFFVDREGQQGQGDSTDSDDNVTAPPPFVEESIDDQIMQVILGVPPVFVDRFDDPDIIIDREIELITID